MSATQALLEHRAAFGPEPVTSPVQADVVLSICIPTYNRAETVATLVQRILQCTEVDIEVVVLDNGSKDDTIARLLAIGDARLSVHGNGHNRGVLFNILQVLLKAQGTYAMLLLDKDDLAPDQISDFKRFLLRERVACGLCEYRSPPSTAAEVFPPGIRALSKVAYTCHHPSGYFFDTRMLQSLDIGTRFVDYDFVGHFPFEFMFGELAVVGRAAIYHAPVISPEPLAMAAKQRSIGTNASTEDAFFSPKGCLKMAINFSRHIAKLPLAPDERRRLVVDRFAHGLRAATIGYRDIMKSPELCSHYHVAQRDISCRELLNNGINFHREFSRAIVDSGAPVSVLAHGRFMLALFRYYASKAFVRLTGTA